MSKKFVIIFSSLFGLLLFVAIALLADRYNKEHEIKELKTLVERADTAKEHLGLMNEHDNLFFDKKYQEALAGYRVLLEDSLSLVNREQVLSRVELVEDFLKETKNALPVVEDDRIDPDEESRAMLDVDTLIGPSHAANDRQDSLERKIVELNRKISSRERALEQKEQLKATTIKRLDGASIQYVGETKEGKAHGKGTGIWEASGSTYKGDWVENERHGYGVYTWKDGVRYEGDFRHDKREGKGTYFWPSGERYVGQWKNNQRNGEGTLYDKDGNITYQGVWANDKPKKK